FAGGAAIHHRDAEGGRRRDRGDHQGSPVRRRRRPGRRRRRAKDQPSHPINETASGSMKSRDKRWRIGFDIGGTFTDFILYDGWKGSVRLHKRLTTAGDPSEA